MGAAQGRLDATSAPSVRASAGLRRQLGSVGLAVIGIIILGVMYARLLTVPLGDFEGYYSGALALRNGQSMYARTLQRLAATEAVQTVVAVQPSSPESAAGARQAALPAPSGEYVYPPAFLFVMLPLTILPLRLAGTVWVSLAFASLVGAVAVLVSLLLPSRGLERLAAVCLLGAAASLFQPVRASLTSGQVDCVLLLALTLSLASFSRGQACRSGAWLAMAVSVKPFLGPVVIFLLWKRSRRAVAAFAVAATALLLAPVLYPGPNWIGEFLTVLRHWSGPLVAAHPQSKSVYGVLLRLFVPNPYTVPVLNAPLLVFIGRAASSLLALSLVPLLVPKRRSEGASGIALGFGLAIIVAMAIAPSIEDIHFTYLIIPVVAAFVALWREPRPIAAGDATRMALTVALVGTLLFLSLPTLRNVGMVYYRFYEAPLTAPSVLLTAVHTVALAALATIVTAVAIRRRAAPPAT